MSEYELHCVVVSMCKTRSPLAELVQKDLDQRFALHIKRAARAKTVHELEGHWREAHREDLAGTFWATLTHPRCEPALETQVLGEVHMLQHQVGMATRVDQSEHERLRREHAAMRQELAQMQERLLAQTRDQGLRVEQLQVQLMSARAELVARGTTVQMQAETLETLRAALPHLPQREALQQRVLALEARQALLLTDMHKAQEDAAQQRQRAGDMLAELELLRSTTQERLSDAPGLAGTPAVGLSNRAVLCVGGRTSALPMYREWVETSGGRFMHHDGGEEQAPVQLESTLQAADVVICQTGCISHDAYWRVKNHCKRTGKRCVYVDQTGTTGWRRVIEQLCRESQETTDCKPG